MSVLVLEDMLRYLGSLLQTFEPICTKSILSSIICGDWWLRTTDVSCVMYGWCLPFREPLVTSPPSIPGHLRLNCAFFTRPGTAVEFSRHMKSLRICLSPASQTWASIPSEPEGVAGAPSFVSTPPSTFHLQPRFQIDHVNKRRAIRPVHGSACKFREQ